MKNRASIIIALLSLALCAATLILLWRTYSNRLIVWQGEDGHPNKYILYFREGWFSVERMVFQPPKYREPVEAGAVVSVPLIIPALAFAVIGLVGLRPLLLRRPGKDSAQVPCEEGSVGSSPPR